MRLLLWWGCGCWLCWGGNRILACCKAFLINLGEAMLGGKVLDLGDGSNAIRVEYVEVFSGVFFLILRE